MDEFLLLTLVLLAAGAAAVVAIILYETRWKRFRQRRIERNHAQSKLRRP